ncbi:cupin domain-containing protein [Christensenellaceae bacterium OttesenSCG-928-K19]|nr:cupin domain-containing protein [Christensenellaceae bacterium OttesenSCG-928-K19]
MMDIIVRKPTEEETTAMLANQTWECGVSEFDWSYDNTETALMVDGEVTVEYAGKSVSFGAGDYVIFPKGLSCVWKVSKP